MLRVQSMDNEHSTRIREIVKERLNRLDLIEGRNWTLSVLDDKLLWPDETFIQVKRLPREPIPGEQPEQIHKGILIANYVTGEVYPIVFDLTVDQIYDMPVSQWHVVCSYRSIVQLVNSGWRIDT